MFILRLEITDPGDNKNVLGAIVVSLCSAAYYALYPCYPLRQAIGTKFTIALCSHFLFYWGLCQITSHGNTSAFFSQDLNNSITQLYTAETSE